MGGKLGHSNIKKKSENPAKYYTQNQRTCPIMAISRSTLWILVVGPLLPPASSLNPVVISQRLSASVRQGWTIISGYLDGGCGCTAVTHSSRARLQRKTLAFSTHLTVSSMRVAMFCLLARLNTQIRLTPHSAASGTVEQHQARWRSMKSWLFMSLCFSGCSRTRYAWRVRGQGRGGEGDLRLPSTSIHAAQCGINEGNLFNSVTFGCGTREKCSMDTQGDMTHQIKPLKPWKVQKAPSPGECALQPDSPPPCAPSWRTGRSWPGRVGSGSPAGSPTRCPRCSARPQPEGTWMTQERQQNTFNHVKSTTSKVTSWQRFLRQKEPFSRRIWDRLARRAESFHPKTRPPPAPSSSPGNTMETV